MAIYIYEFDVLKNPTCSEFKLCVLSNSRAAVTESFVSDRSETCSTQ